MRRGNVIVADLKPKKDDQGSVVYGTRPCVVVQNNIGNEVSPHVIVAPIAERKDGMPEYPVNVWIEPPEGGIARSSYVDCGQLHTIAVRRIRVIGAVTNETLVKIDRALRVSLAL